MIPGQLSVSDLPWKFIIFIGIFFGLRAYFRGPKCMSKKLLKNKIAIITGANSGIGLEIAKDLYNRGAIVLMACKNLAKGEEAKKSIIEEIKSLNSDQLIVKYLNLSSLKSVREFADYVNEEFDHIDILINNGGIMMHPYELTEDGLEIHFVVNYLSHFLLTILILKKLLKADGGRIINVSSIAHRLGDLNLISKVFSNNHSMTLMWEKLSSPSNLSDNKKDHISENDENEKLLLNTKNDINKKDESQTTPREYYALSKLAMVLWTRHMGKLLENTSVTINACHPGLAFTNIMRYMPFYTSTFMYLTSFPFIWFFTKTAKDAAQTPLFCALDDYLKNINGKYLSDCQLAEPGLSAKNDENAEKLWRQSLNLCGLPETYDPLK